MTLIIVAGLNSFTLIVVAWIGLKQELVRRDLVKANGHLEDIIRWSVHSDKRSPQIAEVSLRPPNG